MLPGGDLQPIADQAIQQVFADPSLSCLSMVSAPFKEKCAQLFLTIKKPSLTRSVVSDLEYVLLEQMSETTFVKKYC